MMSLVTSIAALLASLLGPYVTLLVARGQFKATVLSTNRQKWIDTFRDRLSELLSLIEAAQLMKRHAVYDWSGGSGLVREDPKLSEKFERRSWR